MFQATKACFLVFVLALILSACAPAQLDKIQPTADQLSPIQPTPDQPTGIQPTFTPPAPTQPVQDQLALPNPASVFCEEQGGRLEIRADADGNQSGVCLFQDGSECDEWAYFRGECQPGQSGSSDVPAPEPRYVNDVYGFSFDPPLNWSVEEKRVSSDEDMGEYLSLNRPGYSMFVGYQWANEAFKPFRTGMPQGDFVDSGSASLLGQAVPKRNLVWEGKNKVIDYGGRIKVGDLILVFYLDGEPGAVSYDAIDIPPEVIAEADQIIASFALTSGETPQLEFNPTAPND